PRQVMEYMGSLVCASTTPTTRLNLAGEATIPAAIIPWSTITLEQALQNLPAGTYMALIPMEIIYMNSTESNEVVAPQVRQISDMRCKAFPLVHTCLSYL